jgi:UDP-glucose/GDP-mannose dehydrogenase family, NAD binding domain
MLGGYGPFGDWRRFTRNRGISYITAGKGPVIELDLGDLILGGVDRGRLQATQRAQRLGDLSLICVCTPSNENGSLGLARVERVVGQIGDLLRRDNSFHVVVVRIHWLYFGAQSAMLLEKAGFDYDSTIGYNETIGYRAGTSQVFKHPDVDHLLELPLHIMDTALFYPSYMNLSDEQAGAATLPLIENATRFGGVLTINWHNRSLGPERLWGDAYVNLLRELRSTTPWFATASQTVAWFRKRRATSFVNNIQEGGSIRVQPPTDPTDVGLPPLTVRVYNGGASNRNVGSSHTAAFEDSTIDGSDEVLIAA